MNKRIQAEEVKDKNYDDLIAKAKDKAANASTDEEKAEAEKEQASLIEAKEQNSCQSFHYQETGFQVCGVLWDAVSYS